MIIKCTCNHKPQDRIHGEQNRVCNAKERLESSAPQKYTCSVCGAEHTNKGQ